MALTTARISSARWRPPGLGGGSKSLIRSHSASVRSVGYGLAAIPPVYRTGATYGRLFKQPLRDSSGDASPSVQQDRRGGQHGRRKRYRRSPFCWTSSESRQAELGKI